jgi:hypothetical protein
MLNIHTHKIGMKANTLQVFRDPISGYKFVMDYGFELSTKLAIHPLYSESFDLIYKIGKETLNDNPQHCSLNQKKLIFGVILYKLHEKQILSFHEFNHLKIDYSFFDDKKFIAKLFFVLPKLYFHSHTVTLNIPKFRITGSELGSFKEWIGYCVERLGEQKRKQETITYDEKYLVVNRLLSLWKMKSNSNDKLPTKVKRYIFECACVPASSRFEWDEFFTISGAELYMKNRPRTTESIDLFWSFLECVDHLESSDYYNTITQWVIKWLKKKMGEWVVWEPTLDDLIIDYQISTPKAAAFKSHSAFIIESNKEHEYQQGEREAMAVLAKSTLEKLRTKIANKKNNTPTFTIVHESDISTHSLNLIESSNSIPIFEFTLEEK